MALKSQNFRDVARGSSYFFTYQDCLRLKAPEGNPERPTLETKDFPLKSEVFFQEFLDTAPLKMHLVQISAELSAEICA